MTPARILSSAWLLWIASWILASVWSGRTESRVSRESAGVLLYRLLLVVGMILLYHRTADALHMPRLWHVGYEGAYALDVLAIAGFALTWWARIHLGRLWSASVTRKEAHRVVDSGPYALVRHPIYTGLLIATTATAVTLATPPALLAIAFVVAGLWLKASIEERFLARELGAEAYEAYRRRVPMLVPFTPVGL